MADPFSILVGSFTVVDVCIDVGKRIKAVYDVAKNIDGEVELLQNEVNKFSDTFNSFTNLSRSDAGNDKNSTREACRDLWARAIQLLKEGDVLIRDLRDLLDRIVGSESSDSFHKLDALRKAIKLLSKNEKYKKLKNRLRELNFELNTIFMAIDLQSNLVFQDNLSNALESLPELILHKFQSKGLLLKERISTLENTRGDVDASIQPIKRAVSFTSLNKHFFVPKAESSIWTGRKSHLDILRSALLGTHAEGHQKRFVVHGISGSGKTQLCCKFAQDNRESFWAIFSIDGSNAQSAAESWKKIAKIGNRDANEEAGKDWLSNLHVPWLLIIDGADSSEKTIQNHFPGGELGCILITTRNPRLKPNATVGSLTLDNLNESEANELLRKATAHEPWDRSAVASASSIAQHLGYLPLALVHAGKTIYHKLCTLQGYIPFFNKTLNELQKRRFSQTFTEEDDDDYDDDNDSMGAFTTFDVIYLGMEAKAFRDTNRSRVYKDAIELINTFAFLHHNDISLDILIRAGHNILDEEDARKRMLGAEDSESFSQIKPSKLQQLIGSMKIYVVEYLLPKPALPNSLRVQDGKLFDDARVRRAIDLLVQLSLLSESSDRGNYNMHPLVHIWVRKRLSTSVQALWCGVAASVLAASIKLDIKPAGRSDQEFYIRIFPHVEHINTVKEDVVSRLQQNLLEAGCLRNLIWISNPATFGAIDAMNSAKYSRVYMECAKFREAEKLQRDVLHFLTTRLGRGHMFVVLMSIALSVTLWHLGEAEEAQKLQEEALQICRSTIGENHSQTLKVMDALGETYWQRGWLKQAKAHHQAAIAGMDGRPDLKRERFKAMTHLGHVHEWYMEFDEALALHEKASEELNDAYGPDDWDTMVAKDSLAMTLLQSRDIARTKRANDLMRNVFERRERQLGPEHLYTLWAMCNLARTFTERGYLENDITLIEEAETMLDKGIVICRRNLGQDHMGVLMGRHFRANALAVAGRQLEAEAEYKDIAELQRHLPGARSGTHRDRLTTLRELANFYELNGRHDDAVQICTTIIHELDDLGGQQHPFRIAAAEWRERILRASEGIEPSNVAEGVRKRVAS